MGGFIAVEVFGMVAGSIAAEVVAFAINMVASSILSKVFAPDAPTNSQQALPNPGNRQQIPPAGDNKLPVIYGSAYVGGIITDLSISSDNQDIYWVFALSEVTNTETDGTPDTFTFGDVYWGGKKCIFNGSSVTGLLDESTGITQDISGNMEIYLYNNGSYSPVNSSLNAIQVMQNPNLVYQWDGSKLMSNSAFAIIHVKYNADLNLTGLNQTRFQLTNSRHAPGDCLLDYLTSTRYGAAIPLDNINTASLTALNTYSNALFTYTPYTGGTATQPRFTFNGSLDANLKIMQNIQAMSDCCDCLVKYNEIAGTWGVVVQSPIYDVAMDINNSNMIGGVTISPVDLNNSFNVIEVKFPDGSAKDSFNSATFDLATINPSLLFANEPVNKQSVNLYLVNNSVQAQYLANRMLEAAREDLQIQCEINFIGLELEAGDIVTVTNANYGWEAKLFRINKVIEKFSDDGKVTATLNLMEFNPAVYDDMNVTQFIPSPNTGVGSPSNFSALNAPTISSSQPTAAMPSFNVSITTPSSGIVQYAEVWYSAYQTPTTSQIMFAGTTEVQPSGNPYPAGQPMPDVVLTGFPAGDWYFFYRVVNSIATSSYSPASAVFKWRPQTFQYVYRYMSVAYADSITGTGFSLNPRNKTYYGLFNQTSTSPDLNAANYKWYLADPEFLSVGTSDNFLLYINRGNRAFSWATGRAAYAAGTASFVPTNTALYDPSTWSGLLDGTNIIDLDARTGQLIGTGTTTVGQGQVSIVNTVDGQVVAALQQFLDFGGPSTFTGSASTLTIDIYGRVVGFTSLDEFFMTISQFTATSSQTVFNVTRDSTYIQGQCWVLENGILLNESDYTDTGGSTGTVTLATGATTGDNITIISMRAISTSAFYDNTHLQVASVASNVVTWNTANMPYNAINIGAKLTFSNTGSPTQYTVTNVDYTTAEITFSAPVTASAGSSIYTYRASSSSYPVFTRYSDLVENAADYTPALWNFNTGFELPFINGTAINAYDYNLAGNTYTSIPNIFSGDLDIIQFTGNNLTTPTGNYLNVVTYTVNGQTNYSFTSILDAFNLFMNGALLVNGTDYTSTTGAYNLTVTPTNNTTILQQQTFARIGAA